MLQRFRGDFQFASMALFCASACVLVIPFVIYRAIQGHWTIVFFDLTVMVCMIGSVFYAWRSRRYGGPIFIMVGLIVIAGLGVTWMLGRSGLLWTYPILLVSFFIAGKRLALAANVLLIVGVMLMDRSFIAEFERYAFLATSTLITLLAYIFAHRAEIQRRQLETLALYDPLTKVGNRRLMERDLADAVGEAARLGNGVGIAVLDLDHFKHVNDRHGHDAGDKVLVAFADVLGDSLRKADRVYRFGGEEFVLLLPNTARDGVAKALSKVQDRVATRLRCPDGPVTVSIGAALWQKGETWSSCLARADAAVYQAKADGRNRVVVAPSAMESGAQNRRQGGV